jgi:5'-3' exonuclease
VDVRRDIEEVLAAFGIARVGSAGFEADDVIGTLATAAVTPVAIVTGDRDLFQLVDDARGVRVLYPVKGVGDCAVIDEAAVLERYGVPATAYADFAILRGDPSDGLPGVKGIGEKTAAQLIAEFGDLAGVRRAADDPTTKITPARRKAIVAAAAYLDVAPLVVNVAKDVPLPGGLDAKLPTAPRDPDALAALTERWGLGGSVQRLAAVLSQGG